MGVGKKESEAAAALSRARWKKATPAERRLNTLRLAEARQKSTTPEERSEIARKAALARWTAKKKPEKAK